ncbi:MAG: SNF2-related protein, partial [Acidimicrobiales bacterium]
SVQGVWPREFRTHSADPWTFAGLPYGGRKGTTKLSTAKRLDDLRYHYESDAARVLGIMNYQGAIAKGWLKWASSVKWDLLIVDESHRLKGRGAWFKAVRSIARNADKRLLLTGTPMPHSPLDLWAQYEIIDPSIYGLSGHAFDHYFGRFGGYEGREFLGMLEDRLDEFAAKRESVAITVGREVLDLPPEIDEVIEVVLPPVQRKVYDEMHASGVAALNGATVSATQLDDIDPFDVDPDTLADMMAEVEANAADPTSRKAIAEIKLTQLIREAQITGGSITDIDGNVVPITDAQGKVVNAKADALRDLLADAEPDRPVVVFCRFRHDLDVVAEVAEAIGRDYAELSGRRHDLNEDAKIPEGFAGLFGVQVQAGGVGIDLTAAR